MKKLLIGCAVAAMLMTTVAPARAGNDWVSPAILGTIFGVIISGNGHGHSEVIIERRRGHGHHHLRHHRHHRYQRLSEWVEVCKPYPHLRRDRWGDYYTVMRHECRIVKKAIW
jgi:hypothetical protein